MIRFKLEPLVTKLLYIVASAIIVLQTAGIDSVISLLFYFSFILVFVLFVSVLQRKFVMQDVLCFVTVFLAFFCVLLDALVTNAPVSFGYLKKLIMFSATLLYFQTASKMKISDDEANFIKMIVNFLSIYMIVMYFTDTNMMYFYNGRVTRYLTFRFTNPNLTAMFLICFAAFEVIEFLNSKKIKNKLFYGIVSSFLIFFILQTQSRNGLIVMIIFAIIVVLTRRNKMVFVISKKVAWLISLWPLIFSYRYIFILENKKILELFEFRASRGKELDSRATIWRNGFGYIANSPLIGAYNQASGGTGIFQMHNTHIDIWVSYGIVVFICVCVWLFKLINKGNKTYSSKSSFLYMMGFAITIIMGMAEAAVFSGGLGIYIFVGMFLLMNGKEEDEI